MKHRLDYLDSIRGLAALLVVLHHAFEVFLKHNEDAYPGLYHLFETVNLGRLGVIVFFITSGFVIPWSLNSNHESALKNFAIKRFFRLYPAYWFSIIAALTIGFGFDVTIESVKQVLLNFTMIHKFLGIESVIGAYWTLHLEIVFYVICAGLFYFGLLRKNNYLISLVVFFCILAVLTSSIRYYYQIKIPIMMTLGLAAMFYGAVLRNYLLEKQTELKIPLILLTVFYFVCLFAAQKFYYREGWVSWFNTQLFSFALFYLLVTKVKLTHKFFIYIGRISYSLYLLNALVIGLVFYVFGDFAFTSIGFYVVLLSTFIASIFVADLSYRFIEKPGLSLSKRYVFRPTNT